MAKSKKAKKAADAAKRREKDRGKKLWAELFQGYNRNVGR